MPQAIAGTGSHRDEEDESNGDESACGDGQGMTLYAGLVALA
jgi:hypothetical protein